MENNKPVAWMFDLDGCAHVVLDDDSDSEMRYNGTPLYTHPAKTLTMTFGEMYPIAEKHLGHAIGLYNWKIFADAVLKKASEK